MTTASSPARRPLSPKAAALVAEVMRTEQRRSEAINAAVAAAVATLPQLPVRKAKDEQLVAVYDADGKLVGFAPLDKIRMLARTPAHPAPDPAAAPAPPPNGPDRSADDPVDTQVAKALADIDGVGAVLRERAAKGTPTEKQRAHEALQVLGIARYQEIRSAGGRRTP
jgi:hypothetical protein